MIEAVLPFFSPEKIADSGQAFRIHMLDSTHAETVAFGRYLQIAAMHFHALPMSLPESGLLILI